MEEQNIRKPSVMQVGLIYSLAVVLLLYVGSRLQSMNFSMGILVTEFVLILVPPLVFLKFSGYDLKKVLRLNKPGIWDMVLIFFIMLFSLPVVGGLNFLNLWVVKTLFGRVDLTQVPIGNTFIGLIGSVFLIAVSAGICEEVLFRGTIQRGFEKFGAMRSILFTSFLFGLMHIDFQKFLGTFLLGCLIGFIVYRSNSLFNGIFAHFLNNSFAVVMTYYSLKKSEELKSRGLSTIDIPQNGDVFETLGNLPRFELIVSLVTLAVLFILSAVCFSFLIYAFIRVTSKNENVLPKERAGFSMLGIVGVLPGVLLVGFMYVTKGLLMKGIVAQQTLEYIYRCMGLI